MQSSLFLYWVLCVFGNLRIKTLLKLKLKCNYIYSTHIKWSTILRNSFGHEIWMWSRDLNGASLNVVKRGLNVVQRFECGPEVWMWSRCQLSYGYSIWLESELAISICFFFSLHFDENMDILSGRLLSQTFSTRAKLHHGTQNKISAPTLFSPKGKQS